MKYIKSYEYLDPTNHTKHQIDDYVLYSGKSLQSGKDQFVKIIRVLDWGDYVFIFDDGTESVTTNKEILRYLTDDEIEKFEINLSRNKFNL